MSKSLEDHDIDRLKRLVYNVEAARQLHYEAERVLHGMPHTGPMTVERQKAFNACCGANEQVKHHLTILGNAVHQLVTQKGKILDLEK